MVGAKEESGDEFIFYKADNDLFEMKMAINGGNKILECLFP